MKFRWPSWPRQRRWPQLGPRRRSHTARRTCFGAVGFLLLMGLWWLQADPRATWPRSTILAAIRFVESGGRDDAPDGDSGQAIGPFQIHEAYWRDAFQHDPSLGGRYQDCRNRDYAERVVDAYMRRYAAAAWARGEAETIARVHNGGPGGASKDETRPYWERVRARLP